jgi:hypothetical protein
LTMDALLLLILGAVTIVTYTKYMYVHFLSSNLVVHTYMYID